MRGYLIDPYEQSTSLVEVKPGIHGIYDWVGASPVTTVELDDRHTLWLDDEGLYRTEPMFWHWRGASQPFVGKGLVLGFDAETGDSIDADAGFRPVVDDSVNWIGDLHTMRTAMMLGAFKEAS